MNSPLLHSLAFHHIGIACPDISAERKAHQLLGFVEDSDVFCDPLQKIVGQFLRHGDLRVELLEPSGSDSPLHNYLNRGIKMYHQAFESPDLRASLAEATKAGAHLVLGATPAVAFGGREIAFLMLRTTMLVELIQSELKGKSIGG